MWEDHMTPIPYMGDHTYMSHTDVISVAYKVRGTTFDSYI